MSARFATIDDRQLLKLLETGLGATAAAKQLDLPCELITHRVKQYLDSGILRPAEEIGVVDWKAYGKWMKARHTPEAA
ncbi:MAG: hypothetical protein O2954_11465 [bacterium]|nr:hypothetical protein [bacterium]